MAETTARLDVLDQLLDYRIVRISGKEFEVRNPDAIDPLDYRWFLRKHSRILELERLDDPTEDERKEYSALLDRMTRMVLNAPEEVHLSLNGLQRTQIILFFGNGSSRTPKQEAALRSRQRASRSHGKKRSRG